jgi:hypothetical protein
MENVLTPTPNWMAKTGFEMAWWASRDLVLSDPAITEYFERFKTDSLFSAPLETERSAGGIFAARFLGRP